MALPLLFLLMFSSLSSIIPTSQSRLTLDYYAKTCPDFDIIMQQVITPKQSASPTTAAATLRVFFHDCMVDGCDASVLINPNPTTHTEREDDLNHALPGDAFDLIVRAKTALELKCPGVVSCSDILASATRHLISEFAKRIYKFSPTSEVDPAMNPGFAARLRTMCANYTTSPDMAAFLDPMSPGKFDNNFFLNLMRGLDILPSDHLLMSDQRTKCVVEEYAKDQNLFFKDFAGAMEKLSVLGVKTRKQGEVRANCNSFNVH